MLHTKNSLDETGLHTILWVKWGVTKGKDGLPFAVKPWAGSGTGGR